jgi:hypothetical protein
MTRIASIVEGYGEVEALPVLLRRIGEWRTPSRFAQVMPPIRVARDRFLNKPEEFRRHLLLAAEKCGENGWILILLDADDDCPAELGRRTLEKACDIAPHRRISVVLANREYEAWFLAAAESLNGCRGFHTWELGEFDAEQPRNAKGWMGERMASGTYRETTDQPAFSAKIDLDQAFNRSRSFRKLCNEWSKHMA